MAIDRIERNQQDTKRLEEERAGSDAVASSAAQAKQELRSAETKPKDGESQSAEAVSQASKQQDAGESWKKYADRAQNDAANVPNINDAKAQDAKNEANQEEQKRQVKAAELQFDLQIQQQKLRC